MSRHIGKFNLISLVILVFFSLFISNFVLAGEKIVFNKFREEQIDLDNNIDQNRVIENFPLIVFAGEPEGISAAVTAARKGIRTLLILHRDKPGGLMTYGGLNFLDINNAPDGSNLNKGFFEEWHDRVGGKTTFSIDRATKVFEKMLKNEKNLVVYRNVKLLSVNKKSNTINSVIIETIDGIKELSADFFIDASQDADLAVTAEALYFKGGADIGLSERHMAVTLVLHLGNIDWNKLAGDVKSNKFGPSYINKDNAWGFVKIGQMYKPVNMNTRMRGLNIVIEEKGKKSEVYINALLVFGVDPDDKGSLREAYNRGKEEAVHVVDFLKENLAGFEDAAILSFPEELYVRESHHIVSKYQLKVEDLFNNRVFEDTIALASYPLDYQASNPKYDGFVLFNPDIYGIPLRSLIPKDFNNLFVVGRSSGYSSLAAASARVLPTGMAAAEAAAITVSCAIKNDLKLDEIVDDSELISEIQKELGIDIKIDRYKDYIGENLLFGKTRDNNILEKLFNYINVEFNMSDRNLPLSMKNEIRGHIEYLLSWGLLIGGYENDFILEEEISEREFAHLIVKGLQQQEAPILYEWVPGGLETMSSLQPLNRDQAAMLLMVAISKRVSEIDEKDYFQKAREYNLIPEIINNNIKKNRLLNRAEAYILLSSFLQKYPVNERLGAYRGDE